MIAHCNWLKFAFISLLHAHVSISSSVLFLICSTSPLTSSPSSSSLWSTCSSYCQTTSTSTMWWTNTLRTSAEDLGTLAEYEPPTDCEPNDHFITEAYVEYTQESSGEQWYPDDFDYDDVTIGKTLLDAWRRRADHSGEAGLSSCLSSSVSHDRTVRPVVCSLGPQVSSAQETQRHTSESEQIRILRGTDKESRFSLTVKQRFENTNSRPITTERSIQTVEWNDRVSKRRNLSYSSKRRTTSTRSTTSSWTVIGTKLGSSWSSWDKSQWNGRIEAISRL